MAATESKSYMKNHYVGKTAEQVWTLWDPEQRRHFLKDHEFDEYGDMEYSHDSAKTRPSFNELDYKGISLRQQITVATVSELLPDGINLLFQGD